MTDLPNPLSPEDAALLHHAMHLLATLSNTEAGAAMIVRLAIIAARAPRAPRDEAV